jgi:hypothetical protein
LIAGRTKSTYITENSIHKPNQSDIRADRISDGNLNTLELVKIFEFEKFFKLTTVNLSGKSTDNTATDDISYTLYIAENLTLLHTDILQPFTPFATGTLGSALLD